MTRARARSGRRRRDEAGAAALVVAVLFPLVFLGMSALAVDVSRWYLEKQRLQVAADAAALAGVPYMPYDLAAATTRAREVAARNGYRNGVGATTVEAEAGEKPGQLRVTVTTLLRNSFGGFIGIDDIRLSATAVADYQGPAPMGSPCNTFGNEPNGGTGSGSPTPRGSTAQGSSPFVNCLRTPQLWATIEGPQTGKVQGDRYQTKGCEDAGVAGCTSGRVNEEYDEFGYVFVVKVGPEAVNQPLDLQLFDPMFLNTGQTCDLLPSNPSSGTQVFPDNNNLVNPYVTNHDARDRYTDNGAKFRDYCTGDSFPGYSPINPARMVTSFVMREQVDSQDPEEAPVQKGTDGQPCISQYRGLSTQRTSNSTSAPFGQIPDGTFKSSSGSYIADLSRNFHNWVSFCRFTPTRAGDYYLQVRSNVDLGGRTDYILKGNAAAAEPKGNSSVGYGSNSFAIRAVTVAGKENYVAVSGYEHMPIYVNAPAASSTFNLLRVLPGAAGRRISFEFFDAADATSNGTVSIAMPKDAKYSGAAFPNGGCKSQGGAAGSSSVTLTDCSTRVTNTANNGQVQTISIPVPNDYTCTTTSLGGCWYQVTIAFPGASSVTDVTTWNARIEGDPVRLVE